MLPEVVKNLAALGLYEPVSLRNLAGKWWHARVDAAYDNPDMELGCGMFKKVASTEYLLHRYRGYYCEVFAGPFDQREDGYDSATWECLLD